MPTLDLINARDKVGRTPLMIAVENMQLSVIEFLCSPSARAPKGPSVTLENACDEQGIPHCVNIADRHGRTALHRSAALGHAEAVKLLLKVRRLSLELCEKFRLEPP